MFLFFSSEDTHEINIRHKSKKRLIPKGRAERAQVCYKFFQNGFLHKVSIRRFHFEKENGLIQYAVWADSPKHLCAQPVMHPLLSNLRDLRESYTVYTVIPESLYQMCV